jgi:septal ring factor EnvC (AmiA/AmiB activator)
VYSRPYRRPRPFSTALLTALGFAGLIGVSAPPLTARQEPEPRSQSADQERIERLSQRASERVQALQAEADELASRQRTLLEEMRRLELDRQIKTTERNAIDQELAETTDRLGEAADRIARLEQEAAAERPLVEARLVELYKQGRASYVRLLFSSDDLTGVGRTTRIIGSLAQRDRVRFDAHRQTLADLVTSRATLETRQVEAASLRDAARTARLSVDGAINAQTALIAEIDARRDLTAQLAGQLEAARARLDATVAEFGTESSPAAPVALPIGPFRGQLTPPVSGEVTVPYGAEQTTEFGTNIARGGIELAATPGDSVYAVHGGEVAFAGPFEGLGTLIIIDHGDQAFSLYGYLGGLAVHTGVRVDERTLIGSTGLSPTGSQAMYFELRVDGRPVDPLEWLE